MQQRRRVSGLILRGQTSTESQQGQVLGGVRDAGVGGR